MPKKKKATGVESTDIESECSSTADSLASITSVASTGRSSKKSTPMGSLTEIEAQDVYKQALLDLEEKRSR